MFVDIPETSIQTGGGRRWDGQRVELQVSRGEQGGAGQCKKTTGTVKCSCIYEVVRINYGYI